MLSQPKPETHCSSAPKVPAFILNDRPILLIRFREEMTTKAADPFSVILRRKKIPMGLLVDSEKVGRPQS